MYNCVILFLFILPKQTTEVKTMPIAPVTQLHNSRSAMSQTVRRSRV